MSDVPPPQPPKPRILIREVFEFNLISEFERIRALIDRYPIISMDTEFPGVVVRPDSNIRHRDPAANYNGLKANVDLLNLIQIGLTLSDEEGNLPDLGSGSTYYIWEFNFKDFDIARHAHALDSVELLKRQGLVLNKDVTWVTFHSAYDFGFCTCLYGGLDRVCKALGVERVVGKSHQAGSDSLLTLHAFLKIKDKHFGNEYELQKYANVLHGLELLEC
ncbi:hypothetical protein CISIN_1g023614mg [Citrus sinensis]|uniref:poly(A)-specific ribonuclease n=1 Tax=Citrus sinensis TaxID=2711 RepID=A0A067FWP2_CITSI|nr:hypothetical protein CISIN_1g023614mg [Citrus sinensis]